MCFAPVLQVLAKGRTWQTLAGLFCQAPMLQRLGPGLKLQGFGRRRIRNNE